MGGVTGGNTLGGGGQSRGRGWEESSQGLFCSTDVFLPPPKLFPSHVSPLQPEVSKKSPSPPKSAHPPRRLPHPSPPAPPVQRCHAAGGGGRGPGEPAPPGGGSRSGLPKGSHLLPPGPPLPPRPGSLGASIFVPGPGRQGLRGGQEGSEGSGNSRPPAARRGERGAAPPPPSLPPSSRPAPRHPLPPSSGSPPLPPLVAKARTVIPATASVM